MSKRPDWQEFEKVIEKLQKAFLPNAEVKWNEKIEGSLSKTKRQCDVTIRQVVEGQELLTVVECKQWNKKVGVTTVSAFSVFKEDVGADLAIMVSSKGFTESAKNIANCKGIDLYTFRDTKKEDWPNGLRVPVTIDVWCLKQVSFELTDKEGKCIKLPTNVETSLTITSEGETFDITIASIILQAWAGSNSKFEGGHDLNMRLESKPGKWSGITLTCKLHARLLRVLREGKFHFTGLVDSEGKTVQSEKFRIDVEGPSTVLSQGDKVFKEEGGYGLSVDTAIFVKGHELSERMKALFFVASFFIEAGADTKFEIPLD